MSGRQSRSGDDENDREGIVGRKMVFCPRLQSFDVEELIETCEHCNEFFLHCCSCWMENRRRTTTKVCHHFRLIFTDGACRQNGKSNAWAGTGAAFGTDQENQFSRPIDSLMDAGKRTSQRAELLAALHGIHFIHEHRGPDEDVETGSKSGKKYTKPLPANERKSFIIATDSEYVVKGITEWLPEWEANDFHNARGQTPANLDLFLELENEVMKCEAKDIDVGFWHVPREFNQLADGLAKKAAEAAMTEHQLLNPQ